MSANSSSDFMPEKVYFALSTSKKRELYLEDFQGISHLSEEDSVDRIFSTLHCVFNQ